MIIGLILVLIFIQNLVIFNFCCQLSKEVETLLKQVSSLKRW